MSWNSSPLCAIVLPKGACTTLGRTLASFQFWMFPLKRKGKKIFVAMSFAIVICCWRVVNGRVALKIKGCTSSPTKGPILFSCSIEGRIIGNTKYEEREEERSCANPLVCNDVGSIATPPMPSTTDEQLAIMFRSCDICLLSC